jgi:hypothetical protein
LYLYFPDTPRLSNVLFSSVVVADTQALLRTQFYDKYTKQVFEKYLEALETGATQINGR